MPDAGHCPPVISWCHTEREDSMARHMTQGIYQPHWRRMKEKPVGERGLPVPKQARLRAVESAEWPAVIPVHRVDRLS